MRLFKFLAIGLLGLSAVGAPAYAKKDKGDTEYISIEKTGIPEIDKIFNQVKTIQGTLSSVETAIDSTTTDLNTTLGLAADTPFTTAIEDLKSKAEGALQVTLDGGNPQLSTSDAVPANVQSAIDAVNSGVTQVNSAIAGLKELPTQIKELQTQATSLDPGKIKDQASQAGLGFTETLGAVKIVGSDLKATSQTVSRVNDVKDASVNFMGAFTGTFGEASGSSGSSASGGRGRGDTSGGATSGGATSGGATSGGKDGATKDGATKGHGGRTRGGSTGPRH